MVTPFLAKVRRRFEGRVAFVLGGGGNLGAVQVGMLKALVERDIHPHMVFGCSAGAINGAGFAEMPHKAGIARLERLWIEVDERDVMPEGWLPSAVQLARKGESVHDNENLRQLLADTLQVENIEDLTLPFECVATNIECTEETWFDRGPIVERLLASAAIPALYPTVMIDGVRYMDGGVLNDVPISRAVECGARTIYVLHVGHYDRKRPEPTRPFEVAVMAYWIVRRRRYLDDMANLPRGVRMVILPAGDPPDLAYDDFTRSSELIEASHLAAGAHLDSLVPGAGPNRATAPSRHRLSSGGT